VTLVGPHHKFGTAAKADRTWQGIVFDSKREMEIYRQYEMLVGQPKGLTSIERQVRIPLLVKGVKVCTYVADMRLTWASGLVEFVEVKGFETAEWKLKHKLFKAIFQDAVLRVVR
jgi:Protein of unknown function (DUF1064)